MEYICDNLWVEKLCKLFNMEDKKLEFLKELISLLTEDSIIAVLYDNKDENENISYTLSGTALEKIKSEKNALLVMKENDYSSFICEKGAPLIKLEDSARLIIVKTDHNRDVCKKLVHLIHEENLLLEILRKNSFELELCSRIAPKLHMGEKTEKEILDLLKESKYEKSFLSEAISALKKQQKSKKK
jgi:hypothetical protein